MTKKGHKCKVCRGEDGIYVKICPSTGEVIEDYKQQYERIKKGLLSDKNIVHRPGIDEH